MMPALNFKKQFASQVESGAKRQSIRANRKRPFACGDTLYLYTGMRSKSCRKLGERAATYVADISIYNNTIIAAGEELSRSDKRKLARDDGFKNIPDFLTFFKETHGLPFHGQLIQW